MFFFCTDENYFKREEEQSPVICASMHGRSRTRSGARAYKLFEGDRNRKPDARASQFSGQARGNGTWKLMDQSNRSRAVKRDLFEEVEGRL
jgi:hypothetical protein